MTRSEIADQLLTLLAAGHETTATTLAWAIERLRRHPELLARIGSRPATTRSPGRRSSRCSGSGR